MKDHKYNVINLDKKFQKIINFVKLFAVLKHYTYSQPERRCDISAQNFSFFPIPLPFRRRQMRFGVQT